MVTEDPAEALRAASKTLDRVRWARFEASMKVLHATVAWDMSLALSESWRRMTAGEPRCTSRGAYRKVGVWCSPDATPPSTRSSPR